MAASSEHATRSARSHARASSRVRRKSALRVGKSTHMVSKQVERTLRYSGSPPRDLYESGHSSPSGSGSSYSCRRGSEGGRSESMDGHDSNRMDAIPLPKTT